MYSPSPDLYVSTGELTVISQILLTICILVKPTTDLRVHKCASVINSQLCLEHEKLCEGDSVFVDLRFLWKAQNLEFCISKALGSF